MPGTPPVHAVLIDFYGTICAGDREAVERACTRIVQSLDLPVTPDEFAVQWGQRFFNVVEASNHDAFRTLHECELLSLRQALAGYGMEPDPAPFVAELEAYWRDPPIYGDAVDFLSSCRLPICCVSNADSEPLHTAIRKHGLRFDAVVCSEDARSYKPSAGIFQRALDAMGVTPDAAVHIGDSLHSDVGGARSIGIRTVWIRRESRIHDIGNCDPEYTIKSFTDLDGIRCQ